MANTLKMVSKTGSSTAASTDLTVYSVPAATRTIFLGFNIANIITSDMKVTVTMTADSGGTNDNVFIAKNLPIPKESSIEIMAGNKMILNTGDAIKVQSDGTNAFDVLLSIVEIDV